MSSDIPTPENSADASFPSARASKSQRVLSCVLCAQRKVKCDRKSPCANCTRIGAQCVSAATIPRQRRRRFPERELLERLRHYERLLTENDISFEPLHASRTSGYHKADSRNGESTDGSRATADAPDNAELAHQTSAIIESSQAKSFWRAMTGKAQHPYDGESQGSGDESDEVDSPAHVIRPDEVVKAWDELFHQGVYRTEHLLFCSRTAGVELSALHPPQAQIFKFWQLYLENIDPLLKLTHTPTLQARIIDAASDVTKIEPNLEALMFAIYCMAITSLNQKQCQAMFGTPRGDILRGYQLGAREALLNCGFLKCNNRECLTALHLYLISLKPETDPRSLSSMLGTAVRIAQRMGIDTEAVNAKHSVLEAELRRRLWWSLVLFDSRLAEMTEFKTAMLIPTWDCRTLQSVNDFSLRNEMKTPPAESATTSEALFAVVRSKIGDFIRHSPSHLDFINPLMKKFVEKASATSFSELEDISAFESNLESKYLVQCDSQNPLHFITFWWARMFLAKTRFAHHLATRSPNPEHETDEKREAGLTHARAMLECDTMLMSSPLIEGFRWIIYLHFPFPAYIHLTQDLKQRPLSEQADLTWQVMNDSCSARFMAINAKDSPIETTPKNPFFAIFAGVILQAWAAREAASVHSKPPWIVTKIKQRMAHMGPGAAEPAHEFAESNGGIPYTSEHVDLGSLDSIYGTTESFSMASTQAPLGFDGMQWSWSAPNWGAMPGQGW